MMLFGKKTIGLLVKNDIEGNFYLQLTIRSQWFEFHIFDLTGFPVYLICFSFSSIKVTTTI